ncbi:unnamed protein product [Victoria cruziana]
MIAKGAVWLCVLFAGFWAQRWFSTLAVLLMGVSNVLLFRSLALWLGPRPLERTLLVSAVILPVGHLLIFDQYTVRVGWTNLLIAMQLFILARATLIPTSDNSNQGGWRYMLLACLTAMAVVTATRGILGAWFTELNPSFRTPTAINLITLVGANVALILGNLAALAAWREEAQQQLRLLVVTDQLTGLLNRSGWFEQAGRALKRAQRHNEPLTLLMMDLDHFKRINDTYGHEAGDEALHPGPALPAGFQRGPGAAQSRGHAGNADAARRHGALPRQARGPRPPGGLAGLTRTHRGDVSAPGRRLDTPCTRLCKPDEAPGCESRTKHQLNVN